MKTEITIEYLDSIQCRVPSVMGLLIKPTLTWKSEWWKQGRFHKERKIHDKDAFTKGRNFWYFPTGFLPRVLEYCQNNDIATRIDGQRDINIPHIPPYLPPKGSFKDFRTSQVTLINKTRRHFRGHIKAPTGFGKTIIQLGVTSCFPQCRILILAHTVDLVNQTRKELERFDFKNIQQIGGGKKATVLTGRIIVATMQSFSKFSPADYSDYFDIILVDEGHHITKFDGTYGKILTNLLAPIKLAFTATPPDKKEAQMTLEGLIGPLIGEVTIDEGVKEGLLAQVYIQLFKTKFSSRIREIRSYSQTLYKEDSERHRKGDIKSYGVYDQGIVHYRPRNEKIFEVVAHYSQKGKTTLILVQKIEHGQILLDGLIEKGITTEFVRGQTQTDLRMEIKEALITKKIKCVISTTVWREGINIPTLDVVINACGGKSEIMTLQAIGRGLRRTDEKDHIIIVDFFDPSHPYLISHFGERITLYMDNGWKFI